MTDPAPPGRREPTALLLKWADMAVRSRLEAAVRPWRLSMGQMLLLSTIERKQAASPADLARALHLTPQAMTTLLRPLEERGVITRRTDPDTPEIQHPCHGVRVISINAGPPEEISKHDLFQYLPDFAAAELIHQNDGDPSGIYHAAR